jgi:transposase
MYADSFRIYVEQRAVIHLFTLKRLRARAIHTELESVTEALAVPTVKKWRRRVQQGRADLLDDPRSGRPLTNETERKGKENQQKENDTDQIRIDAGKRRDISIPSP